MPVFNFKSIPPNTSQMLLDDAHAQHIVKAMRHKSGDEIFISNCSGDIFKSVLVIEGKKSYLDQIEFDHKQISPYPLTLGVSLIKWDRFEWMVEKLTELHLACLQPLITEFSIIREISDSKMKRLEVISRETQNQCGRSVPLQIFSPLEFRKIPSRDNTYFCDMNESSTEISKIKLLPESLILIGPEGGWSPKEKEWAKEKNWKNISLAPLTLRTETAALVAASKGENSF